MSEPARRDAVRIAARAIDVVDRRAQTRPGRAGEEAGRPRSRDNTRVPLRLVATGGCLIPQAAAEPAGPETIRVRRPSARPAARRSDPPADPSAGANPIRLTRRGRIVVTAVAVLAIGAVTMVVAGAANATGAAGSTGGYGAPSASRGGVTKVVIRPGQSLWSVAESQDQNADTRLVIQQIMQLNSLQSDQVRPGQVLWVPRG